MVWNIKLIMKKNRLNKFCNKYFETVHSISLFIIAKLIED